VAKLLPSCKNLTSSITEVYPLGGTEILHYTSELF